jgi:hypothetical protein
MRAIPSEVEGLNPHKLRYQTNVTWWQEVVGFLRITQKPTAQQNVPWLPNTVTGNVFRYCSTSANVHTEPPCGTFFSSARAWLK